MISYDGSERNGLSVEAARLMRYLPVGVLIMALCHTLFGTNAGMILLPALLLM